jgi:hypothetical protein
LLSDAIDAYAPDHAREVALYRTWLAESYARAGVFDAARSVLSKAHEVAETLTSSRLDRRVEDVARLLPGPSGAVPTRPGRI